MTTKIEWADETWNPILGCKRVGDGCTNCYAITTARIRAGHPDPKIALPYAELTERVDGRLDWTGTVRMLPERLTIPMRWRKPRRIFVNSQSDLFHPGVSDDFIVQVLAVMALACQHTYLVLTKRHGRMRSFLSQPDLQERVAYAVGHMSAQGDNDHDAVLTGPWPLSNLWMGVSVEDQKTADLRIPALLETPAAVRWLSCEPLLGPLSLSGYLDKVRPVTDPHLDAPDGALVYGMRRHDDEWYREEQLHWIVCGGESGPKARPMHINWARSLRDQAVDARVPFLFKQWGEWGPAPWRVPVCDPAAGWNGTDEELAAAKADSEARGATHAYPQWAHLYNWMINKPSHKPWSVERTSLSGEQMAMRRWGKKGAGRELDGVVWDQYPAAVVR